MWKKNFSGITFILSFLSLIISLKLFWNLAIFADENNSSPAIINGGEFWLTMDWLRLLLLLLLCIVAIINIFKCKNEK